MRTHPAQPDGAFRGHGDGAPLNVGSFTALEQRQVLGRLTSGTFDSWATAAARVGHCAAPIKIRGTSTSFDPATGRPVSSYTTDREPLRVLHIRCGNRRADRCPSCSRVYAADMFHLIRCGVSGGKGVPEHVRDNPLVFATLTAPSFGAVHGAKASVGRCHPRSGERAHCPHGHTQSCTAQHADDDPLLGQPLCWECYDYASQVVWQWWAPELWRRFTIALRRALARHLGVRPQQLNDVATVQYAKVAEFQLRGVVHFHALVRCDGPRSDDGFSPAPPAITAQRLAALVAQGADEVRFEAPPVLEEDRARTLRFGAQHDARAVTSARRPDDPSQSLKPEQVAGYLAKYSTKAATSSAGGGTNPHLERLKKVAEAVAATAGEQTIPEDEPAPYELMSHWVHMLAFRGHFATKSRRYSVTLGSLRQARRRAQQLIARARESGRHVDSAALQMHLIAQSEEETTVVIADWHYAGTGWETAGDAALARAAAARAREYAQSRAERKRERTNRRR